jgi:hypothetical protein
MQVNTENKGVKIESNISNQYNNNNIWLNKIEKECLNNNNYLLSSESDSNSDSDTE